MSVEKNLFTQCITAAALAASLFALSACVTEDAMMDDAVHRPTNGSEAYPITLVKGPQTIEVATSQGTLQPGQINAVSGFVRKALLAGVTPMQVSRPSGGGNSARVASEVASLMMQQGVPRNRVSFSTYPGSASAPVRISYVSSYAKTKSCGNWPDDLGDNIDNRIYANQGCAVQANIAAMIANPTTLVTPLPEDMISAPSRVRGITNVYTTTNAIKLPTNYPYHP